jgi:formylglycine-generating enzyme required for sulfatase activity
VWEWCSTKWIENYKGYDKKIKERENLEGDDSRVLRGGAFDNESNYVRAASRYRNASVLATGIATSVFAWWRPYYDSALWSL